MAMKVYRTVCQAFNKDSSFAGFVSASSTEKLIKKIHKAREVGYTTTGRIFKAAIEIER